MAVVFKQNFAQTWRQTAVTVSPESFLVDCRRIGGEGDSHHATGRSSGKLAKAMNMLQQRRFPMWKPSVMNGLLNCGQWSSCGKWSGQGGLELVLSTPCTTSTQESMHYVLCHTDFQVPYNK